MLFIALALSAAVCGAMGIYLTKLLSTRMPVWQVVAPLFAMNTMLVVPFIPFGPAWHTLNPPILALHLISAILLCGWTACTFSLITRGRASGVAVGQAISPAATLIAAPQLLGTHITPLTILGVMALMLGALIPLRRSFEGIGSVGVTLILLGLGFSSGLITVLTAMLAARGIGLPETYIVRAGLAALVYAIAAPPRSLRSKDLPALAVRSAFVTASFLLTILAVQIGSVVVIQSFLATIPLIVIGIEWTRHRGAPDPAIVVGSFVAFGGLLMLLGFS